MQSHKLAFKFFLEDPSRLHGAEDFLPVFHRWIQARAVPEHQLIDVADYAHVPEGPGTVLVSYEANFHIDYGEGRAGLLYIRKQPLTNAPTQRDRLRGAFRHAVAACIRLQDEPALAGRLKFDASEFQFRIYDRLHAPNTARTFETIKGDLEPFARELYRPGTIQLSHRPNPQTLFETGVRASQPLPLATLLERATIA
jgi:hypothetical protein